MLAVQSDIAEYHCSYTQEAVALQMSGRFVDTHSTLDFKIGNIREKSYDFRTDKIINLYLFFLVVS